MKRIGALTIAVTMTVVACGGSNETAPEPDVEVEAVDDDGAFRLAGDDVQVINGCRIEFGTVCRDVNLAGANLAGVNLELANLQGANLISANLQGANLISANLSGANLQGANLEGAILRGADLSNTDLWYANLAVADLQGANLSGAKFCRTRMPDRSWRMDNC